tara:strand:- start:3045 stop:3239 length:195 start_codon:yes stop_codon:yes gene_type:complete
MAGAARRGKGEIKGVRALFSPAPFPDQIRGRCAPEPDVWQLFSIINPILDAYREPAPKARAAAS